MLLESNWNFHKAWISGPIVIIFFTVWVFRDTNWYRIALLYFQWQFSKILLGLAVLDTNPNFLDLLEDAIS